MNNGESSYRRFLAGNDEGLHEIINEYKDSLILYLNGIVQNIHEAEDLTEDTFAELAIKCPKYSGKSSFKTWLFAIGRNIAVKHIRKNARIEIVPFESQEYLTDEQNIEAEYIKNHEKQIIHRAIHSLNVDYRQVIYLTFFENFSNKETAEIMHKSKRQIESLLYSAKKSLKTELERRGFHYEE